MSLKKQASTALILLLSQFISVLPAGAVSSARNPDKEEFCDILVAGGGLAGAATAYEGLLAGKTVCLTEITDWVGGQISAQGTSALDERRTQRGLLFYPRGYLEFRQRIEEKYGRLNPGACWVSESCFLPYDGHQLLFAILQEAEGRGRGRLKWYPNTIIKDLQLSKDGKQIQTAIAIQHQPAAGQPPVNTEPLSQTIEDAYSYENSGRFNKTIIRFQPPNRQLKSPWYVVDATETGELIGLTDIPYKLGIDPRSAAEPTSSSTTGDPYCTQGFTYTFAMQATAEPQNHKEPSFYQQYAPYYSYELARLASFPLVFSYRRIWSMNPDEKLPGDYKQYPIYPGDISMQNWTWGNDYRPGTSQDNLIYSREQLQKAGQLNPGQWMGGLRTEALRKAEEKAFGYFYWLVAGTTDSQLGNNVKKPHPNNQLLTGFDAPMGTAHGLSKYPYMREGRRIIGRPGIGYPEGFMVSEIDITRKDFTKEWYQENLSAEMYRDLLIGTGGLGIPAIISGQIDLEKLPRRTRASIFPDSVGIGHYAIDFHPCMQNTPAEAPGNKEREGERRGADSNAYPFQIPLRAMIPQKIDNMLVAGKSIATSHIAAAAYRIHSFEWSSGAAAGVTAAFALENDLFPYQLVDELPFKEPQLEALQKRLDSTGNPTAFPNTSIFNEDWKNWQ